MGRIGRIIQGFVQKLSGSSKPAQFAAVEEFAGDERDIQLFGSINEDFSPPQNVKSVNIPLSADRGFLAGVAYANEQIAPQAKPGEFRKYSTNAAGNTVKAEVFLKADGNILIKNDAVTITIDPAGLMTITCSDKLVINNDVDINGLLTVLNGVNVTGGTITNQGTDVGQNHVHSGVEPGPGNSGPPI